MSQNEYATLEVRVHRQVEMPANADLKDLIEQWGMSSAMQESVWVVTYDGRRNLRRVTEVARGSYHSVDISLPAVITAVAMSGTDRFVIVHNHPSGNVTPSQQDMDLTTKVMKAANTCGMYFDDNIIVGPSGEYWSMAEHGQIVPAYGDKNVHAAAQAIRAKPSNMRLIHTE